MSRMLGYCLTVGEFDTWVRFGQVAAMSLSLEERLALAFSALAALNLEQVETTAAAVVGAAGSPLPPFLGGMTEARLWADHATRQELKAHAMAAFDAMGPKDQAAFFRHISEIEVAA